MNNRSKTFSDQLERRHRVEYRYAVLAQDHYDHFKNDDPGKPEFLGANDFDDRAFDCLIAIL